MASTTKMEKIKYRGLIYTIIILFWVLFVFWIVFAVVNSTFKRENNAFGKGMTVLIEGPWYVDGVEVDVPSNIDTGTKDVVMYTTLPEALPNDCNILVKGTHQRIEVYADGDLLASYEDDSARWFTRHSASVLLRVSIAQAYQGKKLEIKYSAPESETAGQLHEVRMGSDSALILWILDNYALDVIGAIVLLFSGILVVLVGLIMRFILAENPNMNLSYLGVSSICVSIWMLGESWAKQLYYGDLALGEVIFWSALFIAPIPLLFYISCLLGRRYHLCYAITALVGILLNVALLFMALLGYRDYYDNYGFGWAYMLLCGAVALITLLIEWIRGYHQWRLTAGILLMMICVVLQMIGYYKQSDSLFHNNYFSMGMIIFLIIMGLTAYRSIWKQQEEQQIAVRANETKSDFLANMSHEIRTPINAMLGFDEMILREEVDPRIVEYATNIKKAGDNLLILINDILDFSKIESGKMELVEEGYNTSEMLSEVINMTYIRAREKGLTFDVFVGKTIPKELFGDVMRVKQILLNVLHNSVKYTESGTVTLKVEFDTLGERSGRLRVLIEDTGVGIRAEDIEQITDAFQRLDLKKNRSIEGTGLGMTIVSSFLELMDGKLDIRSEYGHGTSFYITIPQKIVDPQPIMNYQNDYRDSLKNRKRYHEKFTAPQAKILFVDDNIMNLSVARGLLKKTKIQIDTTDSGVGCLEMTRQKQYDLIFMDHLMPEMDGIETLERLRKEEMNPNQRTPLIALTANAINGSREFYMQRGFVEYLSKPIEGDKLEDMLLKLLPKDYIIPAEELAENVLDRLKQDAGDDEGRGQVFSKEDCLSELSDILSQSHIDMVDGYRYSGKSIGQFHWTIQLFAENFAEKYVRLLSMYRNMDVENYTIEVHALKSNAKGIGARTLSQLAWEHEQQSRSGNWTFVQTHWEELIQEWRLAVDGIRLYFGSDPVDFESLTKKAEDESEEVSITTAQRMLIENAMEFIKQYDSDPALALMENLRLETLSPEVVDVVNQVVNDLENFEFDKALEGLRSL